MEIDSEEGRSRLTVSEVVVEDKGGWTCTASNAAGSDQIDFDIEVWQPPESTKKLSKETLNLGESGVENVTGKGRHFIEMLPSFCHQFGQYKINLQAKISYIILQRAKNALEIACKRNLTTDLSENHRLTLASTGGCL